MNFLRFKFFFHSVFALIFIYSSSWAATKTFSIAGNFSTPANWGGALPVAGDALVIAANCTVDNATANLAYGNLTINAGRSLNWPIGGTAILAVVNMASGGATGTLNMTNGGKLIISGTWSSANLTFTYGTGTIEIKSTMTLPAAYTNYYNLIVNGAGKTVTLGANTTVNNNLTVTLGAFTIGAFTFLENGSTTITSTLNINNSTGSKTFMHLTINGTFNNSVNEDVTIKGNLINNGTFTMGTGEVIFSGATSNTVSGSAVSTAFGGGITVNKGVSQLNVIDIQSVITMVNGGLTLQNGTFKLSSASTIVPFTSDPNIPTTAKLWCNGGTMNSTGSFDWSLDGYLLVSAGTVNFGTAMSDRIIPTTTGANTGTVEVTGGNLNATGRISNGTNAWTYIQTGGTTTLGTIGNNVAGRDVFNMDNTVSCSFSMSGGTLIIQNKGGSGGENLGYHNTAVLGSGFTGGTLQMGNASTAPGTIMRVESSIPIYNLVVNSANVTVQIQSPAAPVTTSLTITNDLTISAGVLDVNAGSQNLSIGGDWSNASVAADPFTQGSKTVTFNGSSAQTISNSGDADGTVFNNLTLNNSSIPQSAALVSLNTPVTVNGALTLTDGYLVTSSSNILNLIAGSSATSGSANSYVNGPMTKAGTTAFVFPLGYGNGLRWARIGIGAPSASSTFKAQYFAVPFANTSTMAVSPSPVLSNVSTQEYWQLDRSVGAGNATVTLFWENANFSGIDQCSNADLRVGYWNGASWENNNNAVSTTGTCVGVTAGTVSTTAVVSSFGTLTFGSLTNLVNPLPIMLISFSVNNCEKNVCIDWTTQTEANNDYFTIDKTKDDVNYELVANVKGAGNSTVVKHYSLIDNSPYDGVSYYRLKQTDFNGNFTFYTLREVDRSLNTDFSISLFPNPGNVGDVNLALKSERGKEVLVVVYDVTGRETYSKILITERDGQNVFALDPSGKLESGIYFVTGTSDRSVDSKKLVIR
ncbi:MAG: T9SS type A sorting domain-containing protein [Bacteroidetes bacterium]|nr:T9SS type A sorting domain-containing protein [Bacteroidota bacterium]